MYKVVLSRDFQKKLKKTVKQNPRLWTKVTKTLVFISNDINHPSLRFHKLSGKNNWVVSVSKSHRIVFNVEGKTIYCIKFGTHDEVY